MGVDWFGN